MNKLQCNFERNSHTFIHKNAFECLWYGGHLVSATMCWSISKLMYFLVTRESQTQSGCPRQFEVLHHGQYLSSYLKLLQICDWRLRIFVYQTRRAFIWRVSQDKPQKRWYRVCPIKCAHCTLLCCGYITSQFLVVWSVYPFCSGLLHRY